MLQNIANIIFTSVLSEISIVKVIYLNCHQQMFHWAACGFLHIQKAVSLNNGKVLKDSFFSLATNLSNCVFFMF